MEQLKNGVEWTDCPCGKKNELESLPYTIHKTIPGRVNILEWKAQLYEYFNL